MHAKQAPKTPKEASAGEIIAIGGMKAGNHRRHDLRR